MSQLASASTAGRPPVLWRSTQMPSAVLPHRSAGAGPSSGFARTAANAPRLRSTSTTTLLPQEQGATPVTAAVSCHRRHQCAAQSTGRRRQGTIRRRLVPRPQLSLNPVPAGQRPMLQPQPFARLQRLTQQQRRWMATTALLMPVLTVHQRAAPANTATVAAAQVMKMHPLPGAKASRVMMAAAASSGQGAVTGVAFRLGGELNRPKHWVVAQAAAAMQRPAGRALPRAAATCVLTAVGVSSTTRV
jgi:hypothetical protein